MATLFGKSQKIGNDLLDLVIHQIGIWHPLRIVKAAVCGFYEMRQGLWSNAFLRAIDENEGAGGLIIGSWG